MNNEALAATFGGFIAPLYCDHRFDVETHSFGPDAPVKATLYYGDGADALIVVNRGLESKDFLHSCFHELAHYLFGDIFDVKHGATKPERIAKLAAVFGTDYEPEALEKWRENHYGVPGSVIEERFMDAIADIEVTFWWPRIEQAAKSKETWNEFLNALGTMIDASATIRQLREAFDE